MLVTISAASFQNHDFISVALPFSLSPPHLSRIDFIIGVRLKPCEAMYVSDRTVFDSCVIVINSCCDCCLNGS